MRWYPQQSEQKPLAAILFNGAGRRSLNTQEDPYHPSSLIRGHFTPPIVIATPARAGSILTREQQLITTPPPLVWSNSFTLTFSLVGRIVLSDIEEPGNDLPAFVGPGLPPVPPVITFGVGGRTVVNRQEEPYHPPSWLLPTFLTGFTFVNAGRSSIGIQEQPFHPGPWLFSKDILTFFQPTGRLLITTQEQPYHPGDFIWNPFYPPLTFNVAGRNLTTQQEQPYHPAPWVPEQFFTAIKFNADGTWAFTQEARDEQYRRDTQVFSGLPPKVISVGGTKWQPTPDEGDPTMATRLRLMPVQWPFGGLNIKTRLGSG